MSDFLKKLKGVFVVDHGSEAEEEPIPTTPTPEKKANPEPVSRTSTISTNISGKVSEKFSDILFQAMERNNQAGFDYIEYKRSLQTLEKMPMDEKTRYFSAFAAAQSMGISQQQLIDSAGFYLNLLKVEQKQFNAATNGQREKQIGGKEIAIKNLEKSIQEKGELIAKLTQEIQLYQSEMEAMKAEIKEAVVKIDTTMQDFDASFVNLENQINGDVEKMKLYLK